MNSGNLLKNKNMAEAAVGMMNHYRSTLPRADQENSGNGTRITLFIKRIFALFKSFSVGLVRRALALFGLLKKEPSSCKPEHAKPEIEHSPAEEINQEIYGAVKPAKSNATMNAVAVPRDIGFEHVFLGCRAFHVAGIDSDIFALNAWRIVFVPSRLGQTGILSQSMFDIQLHFRHTPLIAYNVDESSGIDSVGLSSNTFVESSSQDNFYEDEDDREQDPLYACSWDGALSLTFDDFADGVIEEWDLWSSVLPVKVQSYRLHFQEFAECSSIAQVGATFFWNAEWTCLKVTIGLSSSTVYQKCPFRMDIHHLRNLRQLLFPTVVLVWHHEKAHEMG